MKELRREITDPDVGTPRITVRIALPDGEGGTIEAEGLASMGNGRGWVRARFVAARFARNALDPSYQWACRCRYCGNAAPTNPERDRHKELCQDCFDDPRHRPGWPTGDPDLAALAGVASGAEKSGDSPG